MKDADSMVGGRYVAFDGLRGVLAVLVVAYHYSQIAGMHWLNKAWVSVDIFFILSGFVLARAYIPKIREGMSLSAFMWIRLSRLYPFYLFGLLLGILGFLFSGVFSRLPTEVASLLLVFGVFVLPVLNVAFSPRDAAAGLELSVFPMNAPAWSLFFELFVNVLFFLYVRIFRRPSPLLVVLLIVPVYVWAIRSTGVHSGWGPGNFLGGFPRVILFFSLGWVIYKIHGRLPKIAPVVFWSMLLMLVAGLVVKRQSITLLMLYVVGPCIVLVASRVETVGMHRAVVRALSFIGYLSYPVYIIHYPVGELLRNAGFLNDSPPAFVMCGVMISLLIAWFAAGIDSSVRRYQSVRLKSSNAGAAERVGS